MDLGCRFVHAVGLWSLVLGLFLAESFAGQLQKGSGFRVWGASSAPIKNVGLESHLSQVLCAFVQKFGYMWHLGFSVDEPCRYDMPKYI